MKKMYSLKNIDFKMYSKKEEKITIIKWEYSILQRKKQDLEAVLTKN